MNDADRKIKIFGTRGSAEAFAIRDFLHRCGVPFEWVELAGDEQARSLANVDNVLDERLPVCVFPDGSRMDHPTVRQVTEKLGWFHQAGRAALCLRLFPPRNQAILIQRKRPPVEQEQLLLAMSRVIDRIDVQGQMPGRHDKRGDECIDEPVAQPLQRSDVDRVFEA